MKSYFLASILGLFLIMQSCESKKSYISKFDEFVSETSTNCKNYTDIDWAKADTTFAHFEYRDYYKWEAQLTKEESSHVNELVGTYKSLKVKSSLNDLKQGVKNIIEQTGAFINGLVSDSTDTK
jgi:hypothetical protein